jgi:signal transduction histidine kinase
MADPMSDVAAVAALDVVPKILEVICRTTGMGFAAVARVTEDRWIACAVRDEIDFGLVPGGELELRTTICDEIRCSGEAVVIDHVAEDPAFRDHHTPAQYGFQSYISTPILHRGEFFGTLCAIDPRPAMLRSNQTLSTFELFAELIGSHLDAQAALTRHQAALFSERETSELRDQFIAVMGHDLRNPLAAIDASAQLLAKGQPPDRTAFILGHMQASVRRMAGLIDNVMDFARGRLGGGFAVELRPAAPVREALEQVIAELRLARPERAIEADIALDEPVTGDARRIAQLFSNLLANALDHGAASRPVRVRGRTENGRFELSVANDGEAISAESQRRLFQPFTRASTRPHQQGLGLGLYIASQIAVAHGGTMQVSSDASETVFTFTMPLTPAGAPA